MHRVTALLAGAFCLLAQAASAETGESDHFVPVVYFPNDQIVFADADTKQTSGTTATVWSLVVFAQPVSFGAVQGTLAETSWSFDCTANTYSELKDVVFDDTGKNVYSVDNVGLNQPDDPPTVEGAMMDYACKGTSHITNATTFDSRTAAVKMGKYQFAPMAVVQPPAPPAASAPPATHPSGN